MIDSMQMQQLLQLAFLPLALGHRLTLCQCLYDRLFRVLDLDPTSTRPREPLAAVDGVDELMVKSSRSLRLFRNEKRSTHFGNTTWWYHSKSQSPTPTSLPHSRLATHRSPPLRVDSV